jgi:DNA-binding response OmpR family regulator
MAHIAILEDYLPLTRLMSDYLRSQGHKITTAATAQEGLLKLRETQPDLVLVDLELGEDDGLDVIQQARQAGCKSKFLVVTGSNEVRDVVTAMKCGAFEYCTKPFRLEQLHDTIQECLEQKEPEKTLATLLAEKMPMPAVVENKVTTPQDQHSWQAVFTGELVVDQRERTRLMTFRKTSPPAVAQTVA